MNYSAANSDLAALRTPCLGASLAVAKRLAKATGNAATLNRAITDFKDQIGESLTVNLDGPVARVVIMGGAEECSPAQYRKLATLLAQKLAVLAKCSCSPWPQGGSKVLNIYFKICTMRLTEIWF